MSQRALGFTLLIAFGVSVLVNIHISADILLVNQQHYRGTGANASDADGGFRANASGADGDFRTASLSLGALELRAFILEKQQQLLKALESLTAWNVPARQGTLRQQHQIMGELLGDMRNATQTVTEILGTSFVSNTALDEPPMELQEITAYLDDYIRSLHAVLLEQKQATYEDIWQAYHDITLKILYPWDREYLRRMPLRRDDGSIFLSIASYRDENCFNTIYHAYGKAKNRDQLFVGLVQQNCHANCTSGRYPNGTLGSAAPDDDCYQLFCDSDLGQQYCKNVRNMNIDESESLGPYAARYFASKLWYGEQWYMQVDAHMTFAENWDAISLEMLKKSPSKKPVMAHYPPIAERDLKNNSKRPTPRVCGPVFATSVLESQIIRLEQGVYDSEQLEVPAFTPFIAAGYFVAHSDFLREVPFDPFLPWIFMGEEISISSRLWTAGYDLFCPNQAVVGHIYYRLDKPKFWQAVQRIFTDGTYAPLQGLVLDRIKYQLGYPESSRDMIFTKSVLTAVDEYSMGTARPLQDYLRIVGLNMTTKEAIAPKWCEQGRPPPGFEQYNHLYPSSRGNQTRRKKIRRFVLL